jgi:Cation/multidrug efflux pump
VQVQNKLQNAVPLLPQAVQQQGVSVLKSARNFLMIIGLVSSDGEKSNKDLTDFLVSSVQDPLSRVNGVGEVQVFGAQYAMRVWMDPAKLNNYKLTPGDLQAAIRAQNAEVSSGQLGGTPAVPGQGFAATVTSQSRLQTPEQFAAILLRSDAQGGEVRLGDVARVEIGSENYGTIARFNGRPAVRYGHQACRRRECVEHGGGGACTPGRAQGLLPAGGRGGGSLRDHALCESLDQVGD